MESKIKTIFLVEDVGIRALSEKQTLESRGYRLILALSGEAAESILEKQDLPGVHPGDLQGEPIRSENNCFIRSDGSVDYTSWECSRCKEHVFLPESFEGVGP